MTVTHDAPFDASHIDSASRAPQLHFEIPETLLAEVDFKWLMAGHGWHVDMVRFGKDTNYTDQMLDWAKNSKSQALRTCADVLHGHVARAALRVED